MAEIRYPSKVTDVHVHVFNARHLPIQGMLLRLLRVEDGDSKPFRRWLAKRLRDLVVGVTPSTPPDSMLSALVRTGFEGSTPGDLSEQELTEAFYLRIVEVIARELSLAAGSESPASAAAIGTLINAIVQSPTSTAAVEIQWMFETSGDVEDEDVLDDRVSRIPDSAIEQVYARRLAIAMAAGSPPGFSVLTSAALNWLLEKIARKMVDWLLDDGLDLLKFIHLMISAEAENVQSIFGSYDPSQNVTNIVHMQLDMEHSFPTVDDDPSYDLTTQWNRLRALSSAFPDRLQWFAGFDPRRTRAHDVDALCQAALSQGCTGFKFYPPMGYRAAGNADPAIEASCDAFFTFCVRASVPVFTHCTPKGFQARKESGVNGDPNYWEKALQRQPTLRLCLGHSGGGRQKNGSVDSQGWVASGGAWESADNWAHKAVALCRTYAHVYCEFGHVDALIGNSQKERAAFEANFVREFTDATGAFPFSSKCMFGSDAVMPGMVRHTREFLESFRQLFQRRGLGQAMFEGFVSGNAEAFLA